jgi:acetyl-CoA synthetase
MPGTWARAHKMQALSPSRLRPEDPRFNWALDYFDTIARDNPAPALHIVEESGAEARSAMRSCRARSSQVANFLAGLGAKHGDRVLLMLGNECRCGRLMLAAIKLGRW